MIVRLDATPPARLPPPFADLRRYANVGGPMSRRHTEHIRASLLGAGDGRVRCPFALRAGLAFEPGQDPVRVMARILAQEGLPGPEALRERFSHPRQRMICRPAEQAPWRLRVVKATAREVLAQALLLGLCSAQIYDHERPVLWTQASLARAVELFDPLGFYA
jgi:hypothetical protein